MPTGHTQTVQDYAVRVHASPVTVSGNPRLRLQWAAIPQAAYYYVDRKLVTDADFPTIPRRVITDGTTTYTDSQLTPGLRYEYRIRAANSGLNLIALGHLFAGLEAPVAHSSGTVVLVLDSTFKHSLAPELERLTDDLWQDGFRVLRYEVDRDQDTPPAIRDSLRVLYAQRPAGHAFYVLLLGRVPVPYSGNIAPDGHAPDHEGAWPADVFYADLAGAELWTDATVNNSTADRPENRNVPDDGKFDQNELPGAIEARVGRVDMYNLPAFGESEETLLRRYLDKNHAFRTGALQPRNRGFVRDEFQTCCHVGVSPFGTTAWRNFTAFFGPDSVREFATDYDLFDSLEVDSYRWGFAAGAGMYPSIAGFGHTDSLVKFAPKVVFWAMMGSYLGDWDTPNNIMRAALAGEGWALANFWAGRPYWPLHTMALSEPIGLSTWQAQQAPTQVYGQDYGHRMVHVALLGDPTLRLFYPPAPTAATVANGSLSWAAPAGASPLGYYVYGKAPADSDYALLTPEPISATELIAAFPGCGGGVADMNYLVRALYLVTNASGTHYRLSAGAPASGPCLAANSRTSSAAAAGVRIFPQPAGHRLHLHSDAPMGGTLHLLSTDGRRVWTQPLPTGTTHTLSLANLAPGLYLLQWHRSDGTVLHHKVVRE